LSQITTKNITDLSVTTAKLANLGVTNAKIANNTIDLTTKVTGILSQGNGGTGSNAYSDGQLLIGNSSGGGLTQTTLTAGTGITVTNGHGSITLASTGITALTGDATASGPGSAALTLATVNSNVGTFTNATITVNAKGLITAASSGSTGAVAYNVVSKTSAYNAVANDYVIASSTSFTITLPTAVGINGQVIVIQHNGTSLSQLYTLNTTSSQTINGPGGTVASGGYVLATNGEKVVLVSDNANWQVMEHQTGSDTTSYTPTYGTGFGTVTNNSAQWRRVGRNMEILASCTVGTAAATIPTISLPTNATLDSTKLTITANTTSNPGNGVGLWNTSNSSNAGGRVVTAPGTSTSLLYCCVGNFGTAGSTGLTPATSATGINITTGAIINFTISVPISGWQP